MNPPKPGKGTRRISLSDGTKAPASAYSIYMRLAGVFVFIAKILLSLGTKLTDSVKALVVVLLSTAQIALAYALSFSFVPVPRTKLRISAQAVNATFLSVALVALAGALIFSFVPSSVESAPGINEQINFQARLLNDDGSLVADGDYHLRFRIYCGGDGALAGAGSGADCTHATDEDLLWTETHSTGNLVTVANGYLYVQLGSITAFGSNVDWNEDELWLSMEVGGTSGPTWDGEMDPFLRFTSVPYAFNSDTLDGIDSTGFVQIAPSSAQEDSSTGTSIIVNKTGATGDSLRLQDGGTTELAFSQAAELTIGSNTDDGAILLSDGSSNYVTFNQAALSSDVTLTWNVTGQCAGANGGLLTVNGSNEIVCDDDDGGGSSPTLQTAYVAGNTITTTDADNGILFNLADTTDDEDFIVDILGTGNTIEFRDGGTQALRVVDGGDVIIGDSSTDDGTLIFENATNANTVSLVSGATSTSYTWTLPTAVGSANQCVKNSGTPGVLTVGGCFGIGATDFDVSDGSNTENISFQDQLNFVDGTNIDVVVSTGDADNVTINTVDAPTFAGASVTVGSTTQAGQLILHEDTNNNTVSLATGTQSVGSYTVSLPELDSNDTFCLLTENNCAGGASTTLQQAYDNDDDDGNAQIILTSTDGELVITDAASTIGDLFVVEANGGADILTVNSSSVTIAQDLTVNANATLGSQNYLTFTGGTTAQRPGSPTGGEVYFDTDTDQLVIYNAALSKWQSYAGEYIIVAANDSTQEEQDSADYVADGTSDQTEINSALTAATGGKVVLLAGTYVVDATVLVPNNTTLQGVGPGTIIELDDIDATDNIIEATGASRTGQVIRDLALNGRRDLNTAGTQYAISLTSVGDEGTDRIGATVANVDISNFRTSAIVLSSVDLSQFTGNTIIDGSTSAAVNISNSSDNRFTENLIADVSGIGVYAQSSSDRNIFSNNTIHDTTDGIYVITANNVISDNNIYSVSSAGIELSGANAVYNTISGNSASDNQYGIYISNADYNQVTGNVVENNSSGGIFVGGNAENVSITGNKASGNNVGIDVGGRYLNITGNSSNGGSIGIRSSSTISSTISGNSTYSTSTYGINLNSSSQNIISGNAIDSPGGSTTNNGIYLSASNQNSIVGNYIDDSNCSTNCYAINIASGSNNYLADNVFDGLTATIADSGTSTVYANQLTSNVDSASSDLDIQAPDDINLNSDTVLTGTFSVSSTSDLVGAVTLGDATTAGSLVIQDGDAETITIAIPDVATSYTLTLPAADATSGGYCLKDTDGNGTLGFSDCGAGATVTLQDAYNSSSSPAVIATADAKNIEFNLADTTTDADFIIDLQGTGNIFQIQDNNTSQFEVRDGGVIAVTAGATDVITIHNTNNPATGPDFQFEGGALLSAEQGLSVNIDSNNNESGNSFQVRANGDTTGATLVFAADEEGEVGVGRDSLTGTALAVQDTASGGDASILIRNNTATAGSTASLEFTISGTGDNVVSAVRAERDATTEYNLIFETMGGSLREVGRFLDTGEFLLGNSTLAADLQLSDGSSNWLSFSTAALGSDYSVAWNISGDCTGSANGGALTINGSNQIVCSDDAGAGAGNDLQGAYSAGTDGIIQLDGTRNGIFIQDASSTVGDIFVVENDTGATDYLTVTTSTTTVNTDLVVTAQNTLQLVGGTTAQRPGSPSEGEIYFDTDTDSLLVYENGKWQSYDGEYAVVAANDSSQVQKDNAGYVADNTSDQSEINSAISDVNTNGGGVVLLLPGTYTVDGSIDLSPDVHLKGSGRDATTISIPNSHDSNIDVINIDSDTDVTISGLTVDGNRSNQASGSMIGIEGTGASQRLSIRDVSVNNFRSIGIDIQTSGEALITDSFLDNNATGMYIITNTIITNNAIMNSTSTAITVTATEVNISNNYFENNSGDVTFAVDDAIFSNNVVINTSVDIQSSDDNIVIEGNRFDSSTGHSIGVTGYNVTISDNVIDNYTTTFQRGNFVFNSNTVDSGLVRVNSGSAINGVISNNVITNADANGIEITIGGYITVSGNNIYNSGGSGAHSGITIGDNASNIGNQIIGNYISDTAGTGYAIEIEGSNATDTYLADNVFEGTGATSIDDQGTGTIFANQLNESIDSATADLDITAPDDINLNSDTVLTGSLQVTSTSDLVGEVTVGDSSTAGSLRISDGSSNYVTFNQAALGSDITLTWNVTADCTGSANGGALTVNGSNEIVCSDDEGAGAAPDLQDVYDNSSSPATILLADAKNLEVNAANTATDPNIIFDLQGAGDFIIQDNNTTEFTFDDQGNLALGPISPSADARLIVSQDDGENYPDIQLLRDDTTIEDNNRLGEITFMVNDSDITTNDEAARIYVTSTQAFTNNNAPSELTIQTAGTTGGLSDRLIFDQGGEIYFASLTAPVVTFNDADAVGTAADFHFNAAALLSAEDDFNIFIDSEGNDTNSEFRVSTDSSTIGGQIDLFVVDDDGTTSIFGDEGVDGILVIDADNGDNNADSWRFISQASGNDLSIQNHTTELLNIDTSGVVTFSNSLLPGTDDSYDLGSSGARWQSLYLGPTTLYVGSGAADQFTLGYNTTLNEAVINEAGDDIDLRIESDTHTDAFVLQASDGQITFGALDCSTGDQYLTADASGVLSCGTDDGGSGDVPYSLVAANDSPQFIKDIADYTADGTSDEDEINSALTDSTGGKVVLAEGTFDIDGTILVPNNTTLQGDGPGTVIATSFGAGTDNAIEATGASRTGQVIRDLSLDGSEGTAGTQLGILALDVGATESDRAGITIENVHVSDFRTHGIELDDSDLSIVTNNTVQNVLSFGILLEDSDDNVLADNVLNVDAGTDGVVLDNSDRNTVTGNVSTNSVDGFHIYNDSDYNTITGNTAIDNSQYGFRSQTNNSNNTFTANTATGNDYGFESTTSQYDVYTGNIAEGNTNYGIVISTSSHFNTIDANSVSNNGTRGIWLNSTNDNIVSNNNVYDNGGATTNEGIYIGASDRNTIIGNHISDTSCSTTCRAINIVDSNSDNNYLADNTFDGGGVINDAGTGTVYANQLTEDVDSATADMNIQAPNDINLLTQSQVNIGVSDTTGTLLVLDTKTDTGDPTGVNGGIYYNSFYDKFRCYENDIWKDCIGGSSSFLNSTPNSPDSRNEEFSGSIGSFTVVDGSSGTADINSNSSTQSDYDLTTRDGQLLMQTGNDGSQIVSMRLDEQLADGESVVVALSPNLAADMSNNDIWVGVSVNDNNTSYTSGEYTSFHIENNGEPSLLVYDGSIQADWDSDAGFIGETVFLRILRDSSTMRFYYSEDGQVWQHVESIAFTTVPDNIWIFSDNRESFVARNPVSAFHWVRFGGSGVDPWAWDYGTGATIIQGGSSLFTQGTSLAYLTNTADDLVLGGTTLATGDILLGDTGWATFNEQGIDSDFRVEALAEPNALVVQGSDGYVGLGTDTPDARLHVSSEDNGDVDVIIEADTDNGGEGDNPRLILKQDGNLVWNIFGTNGDSNDQYTGAQVNALYIEAQDSIGANDIQFVTGATAVGAGDGVARVTIEQGGQVGIGDTTPERLLDVQGAEGLDAIILLDADDGDDSTDSWELQSEAADNDFSLVNGSTERLNVTTAGILTLSGYDCSSGDQYLTTDGSGTLVCGSDDSGGGSGSAVLVVHDDMEETGLQSGGSVSGDASHDTSNDYVQLTDAVNSENGQLEYDITDPGEAITAEFQFWAGGGTGSDETFFYAWDDTTNTTASTSNGYSVAFNENGSYIRLYYNGSTLSTVSSVTDIDNSTWHDVRIEIENDQIRVYYDGDLIINYDDVNRDHSTNTLFGWGAWTGGSNNEHRVRNVKIYKGAQQGFGSTFGSDDLYYGGQIAIGGDVDTPNATLTVTGAGTVSLQETASAPTNISNFGQLYVSSTDNDLYFLDSAGTSFNLTAIEDATTNILIYDDMESASLNDGTLNNSATFDAGNDWVQLNSGSSTNGQLVFNNIQAGDAIVSEFEFYTTSTKGDHVYFFAYDDTTPTSEAAGNGYSVTFNEEYEYIRLLYNGSTLATASSITDLNNDTWHQARVEIENNYITVWYDGEAVIEYRDIATRDLTNRYFGWGAWNGSNSGTHRIRNIKVSKSTGSGWGTVFGSENIYTPGSVGIGADNVSPNEILTVGGVISIQEAAAPSLTSGFGKLYVDTNDSYLKYLDENGNVFQLNGINDAIDSVLVYDDMQEATLQDGGVVYGDANFNAAGDYTELTDTVDSQDGWLEYDNIFAGNSITSEFEFYSGDGDGADEMYFYAYSDTSQPAVGAGNKYTVEFDEINSHIRLLYGNTTLATDTGHTDIDNSTWHKVRIEIENNYIRVYYDGELVISYRDVATRDLDNQIFGWGAWTGGSNNHHWVRNVRISKDSGPGIASIIGSDDFYVAGNFGVNTSAPSTEFDVYGSTLLSAQTDSTFVLNVQDQAGQSYFRVDTESATDVQKVAIGTGTDDVVFTLDAFNSDPGGTVPDGSMFYDADGDVFRCRINGSWANCDTTGGGGGGTVRQTLYPEYAGGTLYADGSNNNGTMTAGYDNTNRHNYFDWDSSNGSLQDYDIVIHTSVPSDFDSANNTSWYIYGLANSTSSANNEISVRVYEGATQCNTTDNLIADSDITSANTWTEVNLGSMASCTFNANDTIRIEIKLSSLSNNNVQVGEIRWDYDN